MIVSLEFDERGKKLPKRNHAAAGSKLASGSTARSICRPFS